MLHHEHEIVVWTHRRFVPIYKKKSLITVYHSMMDICHVGIVRSCH